MAQKIEESEQIESSDGWTYFLGITSVVLIIYCLYYILNFYLKNEILFNPQTNKINQQYSTKLQPNEMGDTIGGILNPLIAFTASILTFLAFYIQFNANNEQRKIYYNNLDKEKSEIINNHMVNLRIFKNLMYTTINYYKNSAINIVNFIELEKKEPLSMNLFSFKTSNSFELFNKLDFKEMYSAILFNFKNDTEDWESEFITFITTIDYYDKLLKELRKKYELHILNKSNNLDKIGEEVFFNMNLITQEYFSKDMEGINDYIRIVKNLDSSGNFVIPEEEFEFANFNDINNIFFPKFKKSLYNLVAKLKRDGHHEYKKYQDYLIFFIDKHAKLSAEKTNTLNYIKNVDEIHLNYFKDLTKLNKLESFINKIKY